MNQVYQNAFCNLAATHATSGECGLFTKRNPYDSHLYQIELSWSDSRQSYTIIHMGLWETEISGTSLNRRAWVYQERALSRRVLHYGLHQLSWSCSNLYACETYPAGLPKVVCPARPQSGAIRVPVDDRRSYEPLQAWKKNLLWFEVVRDYSRSDLTFELDKLLALSGLAVLYQPLFEDDYLAGLWRNGLPMQLIWRASSYSEISKPPYRPKTYIAPSWLWASMIGAVEPEWRFDREKDLVEVTPRDANLFGSVTSGHIIIKGRLFRANWERQNEGEVDLELFYENSERSNTLKAYPDDKNDVLQDRIYYLSIFLVTEEIDGIDHKSGAMGITISPVKAPSGMDSLAKYFRRVGYLNTTEGENNLELWKQFQLLRETTITII
jgi:hypothetical protein